MVAQVPDVAASGLSDFAQRFGFAALLVIILLYGIWKMLGDARVERKERYERDEQREKDRRAEREADRAAHVGALTGLSTAVVETGRKVDVLTEAMRVELRVVKGG